MVLDKRSGWGGKEFTIYPLGTIAMLPCHTAYNYTVHSVKKIFVYNVYESISISYFFTVLFIFYYDHCLLQYYCPLAAARKKFPYLQDK